MFPISKRVLAAVAVVALLSVTLFAVPAQAAGLRAFDTVDTPTWSIFSLGFWQNAFSPILAWFQSEDHQPTVQKAGGPQSLFDRVGNAFDPNGARILSTASDPIPTPEPGIN